MMLMGMVGQADDYFPVAQSKHGAVPSNIGFHLLYLYLHPMSATSPPNWKAVACKHLGETPMTGRSSS
jgi:hypothetical protein